MSLPGGVLIIDKPAGMSSAQVVGRVKRLLTAKKVGHAGTLDPFATGVLVCLINQATRLAQFLLAGTKLYEAELCLGADTDTQDFTGQVIKRRPVPALTDSDINRVFNQFVGWLEQMPPVYSALKHKGVALYKLARRGQVVQKPARRVRVDRLQINDVALPKISFVVGCSAGTYIRTLCADIGQALGCGGHLSALRRTRSSGFDIDEAISLEDLTDCVSDPQTPIPLIQPGAALRDMPALVANQEIAAKIRCGGVIKLRDFTDLPPDATVMTNGDEGTHYKILERNGDLMAVVAAEPHEDRLIYSGVFTSA